MQDKGNVAIREWEPSYGFEDPRRQALLKTQQLEKAEIWRRWWAKGGAVPAIEQGFQVREIADAAYKHRREVESGDRIVVGVNRFATDTPPIEGLLRVDADVAEGHIARLKRLRKERDDGQVKASLARLEEVAKGADNTVPAILECVEAYCTLGEISQVFRGIFGEQQEFVAF